MADICRVCMINTSAARGGAARMASTLARVLNASGLGVRVTLYHCDNHTATPETVGLKRPLSRQVNALLTRVTGDAMVCDFGLARQLVAIAQDYDVVHLHNLHGYYLNYRRLLDGLREKPVVWTWHDTWPITGRCAISYDCDEWRSGCKPCPHRGYYPAAWLDWASRDFRRRGRHLLASGPFAVVAPSNWLVNLARERGYPHHRLQTIPNPVDLGSFRRIPTSKARWALGLPADVPILLFVAARCNDPCKGLEDFRTVVARLRVNGIAVGAAPGSSDGPVDFVGPIVSEERLANYYAAADALVVPSLADNYPNTTIEAQACGTPVFAYDTGGIPEQLPDFWSGVVKRRDITGLAEHIAHYLQRGGKTDDLSSRLADFARHTWASDRIVKLYLAAYEGERRHRQ